MNETQSFLDKSQFGSKIDGSVFMTIDNSPVRTLAENDYEVR